MRDDPSVVALVARVCGSDQEAWHELVERYAPLVWSICARYQLDRGDIDDVGQTVWLLLVENIRNLREPAALPGWLATTTRRESITVLRKRDREVPVFEGPDEDAIRQHHAALGVPSGEVHQVDSLTWPGLTEQSRPGSQE